MIIIIMVTTEILDLWQKKIFPHNIFVRMETLILSHTINMGLGMLKNQRRFGLLRLKSSMLDETDLYR